MSKWPIWDHFRYIRFRTFPMTPITPQCEVFWALLSSSKHLGVPEDSKSPTLQVLGFTPALGQSGVATLWLSKLQESQFWEFWDSQFGTKWHLDTHPMAKHRKYYEGEGGGFPQVWAVVNLCMSVHQKCSNQILTNLLFSLCRFVRIIDLFVTCPSPHLGAPTCPSTLKMLWARERTSTPSFSIVSTFGLPLEYFKECWGASRFANML
jgi:hypothetical protein